MSIPKNYELKNVNRSVDMYVRKEISIDDYEITKQIGTGSYASVKLAIDKYTNQKVAIKIYDKKKLADPYRYISVEREIQILSKMNHPHIIKLFHVIETENETNLIMEYVGTTSLLSYLKQNCTQRLPETEVVKIFSQILEGIQYMHSKHICHRDIKLENLLLDDKNKNIKIIDLGFSIYCKDRKLNTFCGTPSYMAPEILQKQKYYGPPVDIWTLGILLYLLMCGHFPFQGNDQKDLYKNIIKCEYEIASHVPFGAKNLIRKVLQENPQNRPTALDILQDPWIVEQKLILENSNLNFK